MMTILSEKEIQKNLENGKLKIKPFSQEGLQPASYDLRTKKNREIDGLTLISTLEKIELPPNIAGIIRMRSTYSREGIFFSGGYIDPGYKGEITLSLTNADKPIKIKQKERIAQIIFLEIKGETQGYNGKYQNSKGPTESKR